MRLLPLFAILLALFSAACGTPSIDASAPASPDAPANSAPETSAAQNDDAQLPERPAAIFVVRHAEKESGDDPRLTPEGQERAAALVPLLESAGIDAIYATQWRRTQETAAPIAQALGLDVHIVETSDGFEGELAARVGGKHAGQVVLIIGHSNTNPVLLDALGAAEAPTISDDDYDDVYLMLYPNGEPRLLRLGYGAPTP